MTFRRKSVRVNFTVLLLAGMGTAYLPITRADEEVDVRQVVRDMVYNELQGQKRESEDDYLWSYKKLNRKGGVEKVFGYCETKHGTIHRLLSVNGKPLTPEREKQEERRIQNVIASPEALAAEQRKDSSDALEERKFLKLLPQVFRYHEEGRNGDLLSLSFAPDPNFHPSGMEEEVIHSMQGKLVIDLHEKRLSSIHGRLLSEVKFWGGIAGHLDAGGTFFVESIRLEPGDWELKTMTVRMKGKVLFFKDLSVHEDDAYSGYKSVPVNITLREAAERLKKDSVS